MAVSGFFGRANISRLTFSIDLPSEIFAGTTIPVKITLRNTRSFLPAFLIRIRTDSFETFFPFLNGRDSASVYVHASFETRGLHEIRDVRISSVFPFNFFTRSRIINQTFTCIVFPRLISQGTYLTSRQETTRNGEHTSEIIGVDSDILSIREYTRGDPLKYIHWKATARTGKLKTKELSSFVHQPVLIDFEAVRIPDIEHRISFTAHVIISFLKRNIPVGLSIMGSVYKPGTSNSHRTTMLTELALYGSDRSMPGGKVA